MSKFYGPCSETDSSSEDEPESKRVFTFKKQEDEVVSKRVVKTSQQKWEAELSALVTQIGNFIKIKDFCNLEDSFDKLMKLHNKNTTAGISATYLRCVSSIDELVSKTWVDKISRGALSKTSSRGLIALRQKLKKFVKPLNLAIPSDLTYPDELSTASASDNSDDGSEDPESLDSDSTASSDDEGKANPRAFFLKSDKAKDSKKESVKRRVNKAANKDDSEWETVAGSKTSLQIKQGVIEEGAEITTDLLMVKLNELLEAKTNKKAARMQQLQNMRNLEELADPLKFGNGICLKIKLEIVRGILGYNPNCFGSLKREMWIDLLNVLEDIVNIVSSSPSEIVFVDVDEVEQIQYSPFKLNCDLPSLIDRVSDEFEQILKSCDPFSLEYIECFKHETKVAHISDSALAYLEEYGTDYEKCDIYLNKMYRVHHKLSPETSEEEVDTMDKYFRFIVSNGKTDIIKTRAIVFYIYYLALHDNYYKARDLMLMSHLQDIILKADCRTQIFYNRAIAQLGLCAFRDGNYADAHNCLSELVVTGRVKELLGQGFTPFKMFERTREQELRERQNHLPAHFFMPLELIECCYLTSAMLIDIPLLAAHENDSRRYMISKSLYYQLRSSERLCLTGPSESMREHVVAATKALRAGNWKECHDSLINPTMNRKVWKMLKQPAPVLKTLSLAIKKSALQTYISTYGSLYDQLSISYLENAFDLPADVVTSVLCEKVATSNVQAYIDTSVNSIVFSKAPPKRLHVLALQLADKVGLLLEMNERIHERTMRLGSDHGYVRRSKTY